MKKGFSLAELAIVLIIIGLITGAVLTGKDLIHTAKLNNVVSEFRTYKAAFDHFEDKYANMPGDVPNAQFYFGGDVTDGNGDGEINTQTQLPWEDIHVFNHLHKAGFIEHNYFFDPDPGYIYRIGENVPTTSLGTWGIYTIATYSGASGFNIEPQDYTAQPDYGNRIGIIMGKCESSPDCGEINSGIITPQDAAAIDKKIDDGKPGTGDLISQVGHDYGGESCWDQNTYDWTYDTSSWAPTSNATTCRLVLFLEK